MTAAQHDVVAASPMLTPTSAPKQIYALITSLTELRHQANVFEAALAAQRSARGEGEG